MIIDLSLYSRCDLSNFLQIAQQAANAGAPLPCWVVEQVIEEHARLLRSMIHATPSVRQPRKDTRDNPHPSPQQIGICKVCKKRSLSLHTLECGAKICRNCYTKV